MLRVAEHFERTDTGRQRRGNEDAFFARAPLFAVADGMGGAQAGEVASHLAVEVLEQGLPDGDGQRRGAPARARPRGQRADPRAVAQADDARAGMGTTLTVAYVGEDDAHDRPRRRQPRSTACATATLRAPDRRPLARRGARAPGQAHARGGRRAPAALDHHARARARGRASRSTAPRGPARDGDVFLICCDGLTSMIPEAHVAADPGRGAVARRAPGACSSTRPTTPAGATTSPSSSSAWRTSARGRGRAAGRPPSTARWRAERRGGGAAGRRRRRPRRPRPPRPAARTQPRPRAPRRPGAPPAPAPARAGRPDPRPLPRRLRGPRRPTSPRRPSTSSAPATTASSRVYRGLPYDLPAGLDLYSVNYESGRAGRRAHAGASSRRSPSTSCAPRTTRRTSSSSSRPGSWRRDDQRAQPRAARARPGVAAGDGGLRRGLHRAQRRARRTSR